METLFQTDDGIIRFYDGNVVAIEDQEYSPDGIYNWEKTFNPNDHISTLDGVTPIDGHRYKRVKHSGDTDFQLPYRIIPDEPVFRVQDNILQYKLEAQDDTEWVDLFDLSILQGQDGEQGEQGVPGEGWCISQYGYYTSRPDCTSSLGTTSCNSCNQSAPASTEAYTFMSLGDGTLILTSALIAAGTVTVDTVAYSHFSNDLVTWTALTAGIVDFEARYLATNGTGAVYTDMRTEDYYSTRGSVYACADGTWVLLNNVATPSYMLGERAASTNIGFLDNFIDDTLTNFLSNTIGLTPSGKLEVAEQSIDETAFIVGSFGDGLTHTALNPVTINPGDFDGFGLQVYTSIADSLPDLQVLASDFADDGLSTYTDLTVDGETRELLRVNITDLIGNDSGIVALVGGDTLNDLQVNLGLGLTFDGGTPQAIDVKADDLTLIVDASNLRLKPYNATPTDGVQLQHLNPNIIWSNRGLELDTANGLGVRIDSTDATLGYNGAGELEIPFNAVTGDRLNDNTADNTKGLEISNDMMTVKVDGTSIGFDGSGQLTYIGSAGLYVSSITAGGTTVRDDVIYNVTTASGGIDITLSGTINPGSDTIDLILDIDEAWLDAYIIANHPASATAWGAITGTVTNQTDLVAYISGLNHVVLDTWYNDTQIHSTNGLMIKASSGETFRIVVDAQGNLDTVLVP
jgi:hypothetical protein